MGGRGVGGRRDNSTVTAKNLFCMKMDSDDSHFRLINKESLSAWVRSCVKVEMAILGSPFLIVRTSTATDKSLFYMKMDSGDSHFHLIHKEESLSVWVGSCVRESIAEADLNRGPSAYQPNAALSPARPNRLTKKSKHWLNGLPEFRSCVKVEVLVLVSPSLIDRMVSVGLNQHLIMIIIIIKRISKAPIYHTRWQHRALYNNTNHTHTPPEEGPPEFRVQELCESRGSILGSPSRIVFVVSVDVKQH